MDIPKFFKQVLWALFLTVLLLGVPRLAGAFADLFDYSAIDPDGAFAWISVHHIAQGNCSLPPPKKKHMQTRV
jgi:uncharacterized protein